MRPTMPPQRMEIATQRRIHRRGDDRDADQVGDHMPHKQAHLVAGTERNRNRNRSRTDGQRKRQGIEAAAADLALPGIDDRRRRWCIALLARVEQAPPREG
jgi:hypothetical protein